MFMVDMDALIAQVRNLNACGHDREHIHFAVTCDLEVTEGDFFLAYVAATMLPGWRSEEKTAETQSFYEDLFG